jgi:hypothetical protein
VQEELARYTAAVLAQDDARLDVQDEPTSAYASDNPATVPIDLAPTSTYPPHDTDRQAPTNATTSANKERLFSFDAQTDNSAPRKDSLTSVAAAAPAKQNSDPPSSPRGFVPIVPMPTSRPGTVSKVMVRQTGSRVERSDGFVPRPPTAKPPVVTSSVGVQTDIEVEAILASLLPAQPSLENWVKKVRTTTADDPSAEGMRERRESRLKNRKMSIFRSNKLVVCCFGVCVNALQSWARAA